MSNTQPSREGNLRLYDAATESQEFRAAQVRQLYIYSRASTMGALLGLMVVALATREYIPHTRLIAWIAVYFAIQGPRYYLVRTFSDKYRSAAEIIQWGRKFSFLTFLSALVWGATAILMFPAGSASQQMLIVIALAGISSAATVVYSPLKECYAPAVVAILLPLSLRYFYEGGETNTFIGVYIFLFAGVLLITGRLMHRFVINSLKLQFDKTDLVESLSEQKRVSDLLNQELMAEIKVRKHADEALRVQTEKFQMLSDSAPFGMVMIGKDGTFEYLNPKFKEILGYDLSDVPNGREWIRKAYPDSAYKHEVVSAWKEVFEALPAGEPTSRVFTVRCKDGSSKSISFRPVKLLTGEDLMTCEDITDRMRSEEEIKKADAALRESEERYRAVFDNAGIGIGLADRDGRIRQVNNALMSMLGYTEREFYQLKFGDITHPDDRESSTQRLEKVMREEISSFRLEKRFIKKDGSTVWVDLSVSAIRDLNGKHIATIGAIADITGRKRTEDALREANEVFYTFADQLPAVFFIKDHDSRVLYINRYTKEVFDGEDWMGCAASQYFMPDVANAVLADDKKVLSDGAILREQWIPDKKGEKRLWETRKFPIFREGKPPLLGGVSIDITARKQAEEKLEQEKAISDSIIDSLPGTFYLFDHELRFVRWNENLEKLTGYSADEMSTMSPLDFFPGEAKALIHAAIGKVLIDGAFSVEADIVTKEGAEIPYWFNSKLLKLHEKQYIIGLGIDLTARKLAENALKTSLKEKEILLREIHHRVKNNLQLISSLLRLQLRQIKHKDEGLVDAFADIQGRIKAMALVHEALYESENLELVDGSLYVKRIVDSLRDSSTRSRQELHVKTDVKSITFTINVALALGLIVNELVTNSLKHAFPEDQEGEVVVTLESTGEAEFQLTVRDNGVGMPQHIDLEHLESLGLELVTDLARQLNGTVEFARGEGTEFRVRFKGPISHNDRNPT